MIKSLNKAAKILSTGVALSIICLAAPSVYAATPADTLVEGFAIDDIISLDPAEAFELSTAEVTANAYSKLINLDLNDTSKVVGDLAESWTVSDDGLTFTFKLKSGVKFASGNALTAEDVAYSFERVVKLDKSPAFLLTQFGLDASNVTEMAKAVDETTFALTIAKPYAPSFVLNVLTSSAAAVVDKKLLQEKAKAVTPTDDYKFDNDFGNEFMKTGYAGSGPYKVLGWKANEAVIFEVNPNYYGEAPKLKRVIFRHMKESSGQRLALENGDIDVARNLEPNDLAAVAKNENIKVTSAPKGTVYYISLNQKNENLAKPEVIEAFKHLVDYDAIGATLIKGVGEVHQNFLPKGYLGALEDKPYSLNVEKAKELLEKAGLKDGFTVTMDVRNTEPVTGISQSFQQSLAQAGIKMEIIPGDGKQTLTKYRARQHDLYIGQWGADYFDPHSNAQTFSANYDNADEGTNKTLAWRNAWAAEGMTEKTEAALLEKDSAKRAALYGDIQREVREKGPFVMLYQQIENAAISAKLKDFKLGPSFDLNLFNTVSKD
jgi:peptide/nickel transport system substrate-binding protein